METYQVLINVPSNLLVEPIIKDINRSHTRNGSITGVRFFSREPANILIIEVSTESCGDDTQRRVEQAIAATLDTRPGGFGNDLFVIREQAVSLQRIKLIDSITSKVDQIYEELRNLDLDLYDDDQLRVIEQAIDYALGHLRETHSKTCARS